MKNTAAAPTTTLLDLDGRYITVKVLRSIDDMVEVWDLNEADQHEGSFWNTREGFESGKVEIADLARWPL